MQIYSDMLFVNPVETVEVFDPEQVKAGLDFIEELKNKGLYLFGYMRYDLSKKPVGGLPLIYFEAFDRFEKFTAQIVNKPVGTIIRPLINKSEYVNQVEFIKSCINDGISYEVNYTYPSSVETNVCEFELYNFLLQNQKTPYNAFIKNKYETILSFSPELFFSLNGRKIRTKPMKGTFKRGNTKQEDEAFKSFLYNDEKNRAENIMIVDLLRNDLGKISKPGSVKVDKLFDIEAHKTLFQMTSEICAELDDDITLFDIINAIYPCGSITGAPKISTMRVIEQVEKFPREVYCAAIGYLHNDEAVFSVPIRILQKKHDQSIYRYFAGGAIVWDSTAEDEWNETLTKTKFLQTDFSLIETCVEDFELHLARLKNSASVLGFTWNEQIEKIKFQSGVVSRIELFKDGSFNLTTRDIAQAVKDPKIRIGNVVNSNDPFLYHKTSIREDMPKDVFDEIRVNEKGEITEGTFTNIALKKSGRLYTPPLSCGLLNGILRQKLLAQGEITEKIIYPEDLKSADQIFCFNSVRGMVEVTLC